MINKENLLPEGWEQQIGDEDLPHPEGREYEGQFTAEEWENKIREHKKWIEIDEMDEKENMERREIARKKEKSWELARLCREYIQENSRKWRKKPLRQQKRKNKR